MIYAVSEEGVSALKRTSSMIIESWSGLFSLSVSLQNKANEHPDSLGPHRSSLFSALNSIYSALKEAGEPIKTISATLNETAEAYQEIIDNDRLAQGLTNDNTSSGNAGNIASNSVSNASLIENKLKDANVANNPLKEYGKERSSAEIVGRLGGGDLTEGSCSSLAFAYVGNTAGYDVLDFRDGASRSTFSSNDTIVSIANLSGVDSKVIYSTDDISATKTLLDDMKDGKEYYLATGLHAAIVRKNGNSYDYLELQDANDNGWHKLDAGVLSVRFGCVPDNLSEYPNILIDCESLSKSKEFIGLLGYINTAEEMQRKGDDGSVK